MLHKPFFYTSIHKIHHEHKVSTSIAMMHAHPLEYVFGNVGPATLGVVILGKRMHLSSYMAWNFVRLCNSLDGHCGYDFTWVPFRLLPFKLDGQEHPYHHSENIGSYGSFLSVWDTYFGSNSMFWQLRRDSDSEINLQKAK